MAEKSKVVLAFSLLGLKGAKLQADTLELACLLLIWLLVGEVWLLLGAAGLPPLPRCFFYAFHLTQQQQQQLQAHLQECVVSMGEWMCVW